jgi:hypothetical protein
MCEHNFAKYHPKDDCIICFHSILDTMTLDQIKALITLRGKSN